MDVSPISHEEELPAKEVITSVSKSSYVLGDSPPDPRFLASLGALSLVKLSYSVE